MNQDSITTPITSLESRMPAHLKLAIATGLLALYFTNYLGIPSITISQRFSLGINASGFMLLLLGVQLQLCPQLRRISPSLLLWIIPMILLAISLGLYDDPAYKEINIAVMLLCIFARCRYAYRSMSFLDILLLPIDAAVGLMCEALSLFKQCFPRLACRRFPRLEIVTGITLGTCFAFRYVVIPTLETSGIELGNYPLLLPLLIAVEILRWCWDLFCVSTYLIVFAGSSFVIASWLRSCKVADSFDYTLVASPQNYAVIVLFAFLELEIPYALAGLALCAYSYLIPHG
jgi:hypothetical protein